MSRVVGVITSAALITLMSAAPARTVTAPAVSDSFDRANASSLGTADSGQLWQNHIGGFSVAGNSAAAGNDHGLATLDSGLSDSSVGVTVATPGDEFWLVVRLSNSANYWRFGRWRGEAYQLQQIRADNLGSPTIQVLATVMPHAGDRLECRVGAWLLCSVGDLAVARTSDTFASSASRHGLSTWNSPVVRFDDFSVAALPLLADLGVTVAAPAQVPSGATIQASATVVNSGPATARDVVLEWSHSAGLNSVLGSGPGGPCTLSGSLVRCAVGDLASGATASVSLSATAPAATGTVTLAVRALQNGDDAHPADDTATASVVLRPDLSATTAVSDGFNRANAASSLGVAETGQAWNTDVGRAGIDVGKAAPGPGYTLASLYSGLSTGTVRVTVSRLGPEFWLVMRLSGAADYWRFGRSSGGAYQLQQIRGDDLGSPVLDRLATRQPAAGDLLECRLTAAVISCSVDGTAVVRTSDAFNRSAAGYGFAAYESPQVRLDDFVVERPVPQPDLRTSVITPARVSSGSEVDLSVTVRNTGEAPATGTSLRVSLPAGATAHGAQASSGTCTTSSVEVICELGSLQAEAAVSVAITARAPGTTGTHTTSAVATTVEADADPDDNRATATTVVYDSSQPSPVVVDSFDRGDASTLGAAMTGQAWQVWSGSPSVDSNAAAPGPGHSVAVVDSGAIGGVVAATLTKPGTEFWLVVRAAGAGDYWRFGRWRGEAYQLQLIRSNGLGSPALTLLDSMQPAAGDRIECRVATGLACSVNGHPVVRTSDTAHATATAHGLGAWNSPETRFDDFQIGGLAQVADLAATLTGTHSVTVSGTIQLRATANNTGTLPAQDVALDGTVSTGVDVGSVTGPAGPCSVVGRSFHCALGNVAAGAEVEVTVAASAPAQAGPVTSVVRVSHPGSDADPANDQASLTTTVRLPAPTGAAVVDGFDRVAPAGGGLGSTDSGEAWQVLQGNVTIESGQAKAATGSASLAVVDAGFAFGTFEVTIAAGASERFWLAFRVVDANNYLRLGADPGSGNYQLTKVIGGVEHPLAISFIRAGVKPKDGDVVRIVLRPDDGIYVYVNREQIIDAGDSQFMDATRFGLATASTAPRFDGLEISSTLKAFPINDTFSRPDAQTLGAPEEGTRYPWNNWQGPSWAVDSGHARYTSGGYGLTAIDSSTEMAGVRTTFTSIGDDQWLVFRYGEDGSYYRFGATGGGQYKVEFVRNGSASAPVTIDVVAARTVAAGDVVEIVQRLGGAVEGRVNGAVTHRFTDPTTNARATSYGLATYSVDARFDDFAIVLPPR